MRPEEFNKLFNAILINVTHFFRDEAAWKYLEDEVLPALIARRPPTSAIRVWSAGCASGEEAYTIAMVFAELLGTDVFRDRVKIYGTDVDEDALNKARHASYTAHEAEGVPPATRDAAVAVASTLGVLVPPSLVLILLSDAMLSAHTVAVTQTGRSDRERVSMGWRRALGRADRRACRARHRR